MTHLAVATGVNDAPHVRATTVEDRVSEDSPAHLFRTDFDFADPDDDDADLTLIITGLSGQVGATLSWKGAVHDFTKGPLEITASELATSTTDNTKHPLVLTPAADSHGTVELAYKVRDAAGLTSQAATVTLPVAATSSSPPWRR